MRKSKLISTLFLLIFSLNGFCSCKGSEGPVGPQGEQGIQGEIGNGISSITKSDTNGLIDTYTITYTDGTTSTFTVTNGKDGTPGIQGIQGEPGKDGHTPVITIEHGYWYIDGVNTQQLAQGVKGDTGNGISSITKTNTNGLIDTYTITYTDGSTTTFTVTNGKDGVDGKQGIQGEPGKDGHTPIITIHDGNWYVDGIDTNVKATYEIEKGKWSGKDAIFIGDSITNGVGTDKIYYEFIQEELDLNSATGYGVSGSCFSSKSDYGLSNSPLASRYDSLPSSDLIMVFMGTNDYGHETPLGSIEDTTDISFYGALNVVVNGLISKNPTSSIVFVTPLHRYGFGTSKILNEKFTYDYLPNGRGHSLKDYRDAIINVCERYSLPVIDLYANSGINPCIKSIKNTYFPDGIHPNEKGHERIASIMCNYLQDVYVGQKSNISNEIDNSDTSMIYGNKFVSSASDHNRASSNINFYLLAGQTIRLLDNEKYKWALAGTDSRTSTIRTHGYYPESAWSSIDSYTITKTGYYGILLMTTDNSIFDFESDPESNNIYNYIIIE